MPLDNFKDFYKCRFCGQTWEYSETPISLKWEMEYQKWNGEIVVHMARHLLDWLKKLVIIAIELKRGAYEVTKRD